MIFDREQSVNNAIRDFFKRRTQRRKKLEPFQLSNPKGRKDLQMIMSKAGAKNLFEFCDKIRRYEK